MRVLALLALAAAAVASVPALRGEQPSLAPAKAGAARDTRFAQADPQSRPKAVSARHRPLCMIFLALIVTEHSTTEQTLA